MSCKKCGNSNTNCGCKDTAYTTVRTYTCPPDSACPTPLKCSEFFDAACVFMTDGIADAGIQPGSSLESIIQQLIMLVTNPACVDAPGGVPGGGTVNFVDAIWPGNAITIAGGPIQNSGTFIFNGNGNSSQYIDGQGNLQTFPAISGPVEFQTNGTPNDIQDLLNLVAGTGITLTNSGGSVTIDVDAVVYAARNGLSEQPLDSGNFELGGPTSPGAPLLHDTYIDGAQYAFEITDTSSMFLQGNRVDIEGSDPGVMILSTGGPSDNSVEVTGTQVAIESVGGTSTRIFLDPATIKIQTPLFNTKDNGDVLTLIDNTTGEVEFMPVTGALFQTDGNDNTDQDLLNLVSGNGITLTNTGGDVTIDGPLFQTNSFDNSTQTLLNLAEGTGITLTESGGTVTIDASAPAINLSTLDTGGAADYDPTSGDLNIPVYQSQIDVQDEGVSKAVNPTVINFVGDGVTADAAGTVVTVTIPGGGSGPGNIDANNGLLYNLTDPLNPVVQLGGPDTAPAPLLRNSWISTGDFDFHVEGNRGTKAVLDVKNIGGGSAVRGESTSGISVFGVTGSGYSGYFDATSSAIGVYSVNKGGLLAAQLESISLDTSSVLPVLMVQRTTTGTAQAGLGGTIAFSLENDANAAINVGALGYSLVSAANASPQSKFSLSTRDGGTTTNRLEVLNTGQLVLNNYTTSSSFDPDSGPSVGVLNVDNTGKVFVTTGGGGPSLAVEVDGTPLSSSTLLNFVPSTDIGITDLGGGFVQFTFANPLPVYTVNNGLEPQTTPSSNPNNFQLGGSLVRDTTIINSDKSLTITGNSVLGNDYIFGITSTSGLAPTGGGSQKGLFVELSGANTNATALSYAGYFVNNHTGTTAFNRAIYGETSGASSIAGQFTSTGGTGVSATADGGGNAIIATVTSGSGNGIFVSAQSGQGVYSKSVSNVALETVTTHPSFLSSVITQVRHNREAGVGTIPGNGVGLSEDFYITTSNLPYQSYLSNQIISKWANATSGSRTSEFIIAGVNNTVTQSQFTILGGGTSGPGGAWSLIPGQIKFDRYAGGVIYKPADDIVAASGFNLGIDANGNIWATDFSTSTGPVTGVSSINIGTLSNGASATVTNPSGPAATINITGQNAYTQIGSDSGTASADTFNSLFSVVGADGITTSLTNGTMPASDVITVTGPDKFLSFVTKNISGTTIATYTPTVWNDTLNIQAGTGIVIENGGSANTIVVRSTGGGISSVGGTNANGFTVTVADPTSTPNITVGTSVTGILVGDGAGGITNVSTGGGSGVLTYDSVTNTYSYTTLPTVNDGQLLLSSNAAGLTNTGVAIGYSAGGTFTANKSTNSSLQLSIGPAITGLVNTMTGANPANPASSPGASEVLPRYITKLAQDTYLLRTPVTVFSTGTTGLSVTNAVSSAVSNTPLNGQVVLGGVLNVANGGTGTSTGPTAGQILIGNSSGGYSAATVTGSGGTTVTLGDGTINISSALGNISAKNGTYVNVDGSVRLGSGPNNIGGTAEFPNSLLLEPTIIRMNSQNYRLSDGQDQAIQELGFDINDATNTKAAYLGASTRGFWFSANTAGAAAPSSGFQGFVYGGQTTNAFPTNMGGFFHRATGSAAFPTTFGGFANDVVGTRVVMGYLGTTAGVYEVINRNNNTINHHGLWGGAGGTVDFLMYQANATSKLISFGDVTGISGNGTRLRINDSTLKYEFNTGTIYAAGYGGATPVAVDGVAKYVLGTSSTGKFYEIPAVSIGSIVVAGSTPYTPSTLATTGAPNALTVAGTGTVGVTLSGSTLTINGTGVSAFPYWSTVAFTKAGTGTLTNNGSAVTSASISPDTIGANQLNIQAGNNIGINVIDTTTNRIEISAIVPTAGVSFGTANLTAIGTGTQTGQSNITAATPSGIIGLIAGNGISFAGNSTAGTITISSIAGLTSIVGSTNGSVSVNVNSSGVATVTGPSIWNTIAVPTPGGNLGPQVSLTPDTVFDTLNFAAGAGITISTSAVGNADTITISSIAAATNSWGDITFGGNSTPAVSGGSLVLQPDTVSDGLSVIAGTGIGITVTAGGPTAGTDAFSIRNTGVLSITPVTNPVTAAITGAVTLTAGTNVSLSSTGNNITINASGGSGTVTASEGLTTTTAGASTVVQLGSSGLGGSLITVDRYIGTQTKSIFLSGDPGAGVANMQITSTGAGRALRVLNSSQGTQEGALFVQAPIDASVDSAPTGALYATTTAKGHAIVGISPDADALAISAIFGKGRQGVKGYSAVASGTGIIGESLKTVFGIGVVGLAQGRYDAAGETTPKSYAGYFIADQQTDIDNSLEVLRLDRTSPSNPNVGAPYGSMIGFWMKTSSGTLRAGRAGYEWSKQTAPGDSEFTASVIKRTSATGSPSVAETVRLRVKPTGQLHLSRYTGLNSAYSDPAVANRGPFPDANSTPPTLTGLNFTSYFDYLLPGAVAVPSNADDNGRLDTIRNIQGGFTNTVISQTPANALASAASRSGLFHRHGNVVTGKLRIGGGAITSTGTVTIVLTLPVPAVVNFGDPNQVIGRATFKNDVTNNSGGFGVINSIFLEAVTGTTNKMRITLNVVTAQTSGITNEIDVDFSYLLY